jgi:sugar phosphate isomerase/epimerase
MLKQTLIITTVLNGLISLSALAQAPQSSTTRPARRVADFASCSSLCQVRQPFEKAAPVIAEMGYKYLDLSCLNWAPSPPHANVAELMKDFDKEALRIEKILAANKLKVSNLTFDGIDAKQFDAYTKRFEIVMKLANRLDTRLVNIMAPPKGADKQEMADKLEAIQKIAAQHKVKLTLETHTGQLTEFPADAVWLCKQAPGVGLTLDPSHYYAGPNQGKSFEEVYPYVFGTGFRAGGMEWATVQMPWGEGPIDFGAIVREMESHGYQGFYVVEYIEGFNKLDPVVESRRFLEWIRALK